MSNEELVVEALASNLVDTKDIYTSEDENRLKAYKAQLAELIKLTEDNVRASRHANTCSLYLLTHGKLKALEASINNIEKEIKEMSANQGQLNKEHEK